MTRKKPKAGLLAGELDGAAVVCAAECYEATEQRCTCICGGRYHGKGYEEALALYERDQAELLAGGEAPAEELAALRHLQLALPVVGPAGDHDDAGSAS